MSVYDIFVLMYYALDAAYEEHPDEALLEFLSDANPFVFKGEGSADPSVYNKFLVAYNKYGSDGTDNYSFVCKYIDNECDSTVKKAFSTMSKTEWDEAKENYLRNKTAD